MMKISDWERNFQFSRLMKYLFLQKILVIAFCIIALGLATDIMDFIEKESELQEGFVFGQGWSWVKDTTEQNL